MKLLVRVWYLDGFGKVAIIRLYDFMIYREVRWRVSEMFILSESARSGGGGEGDTGMRIVGGDGFHVAGGI